VSLSSRLRVVEAAAVRQYAAGLAAQHGIPLAKLLALAEKIAVDHARFRSQYGRDMTRREQVAHSAARHGIAEAKISTKIEASS
jgi:hypothetical protein